MPKKYHLYLFLLLVSITTLVYYDSFNNSFVYDDYPFIVENKAIRKLDMNQLISYFTSPDAVSSHEGLSRDVWRPLMTVSFAVDYRLWALQPRFYHIENTLLHIGNSILVYIAIFLMLGNTLAAFVASVVFAIHPVQTEAVTWISGRANVLFLFFFLLSFIFHIRERRKDRGGFDYTNSLVLFLCALLSKEMAIVLPLIFILYDAYFYGKKGFKYYVLYYLPFLLISVFYVLARSSVTGGFAQREYWWGGGLFTNFLMTLKAVAEYIRIIVFPLNLKILYLMPAPASIFTKDMLGAILVLSGVVAFYLLLRKKKVISFYFLWFFVALIPVYNIVPFKAVMAERFLYLPLIAFAAGFGMLFAYINEASGINPRLRTALNFSFVGILIFYGALTISRNIEWRDELTFYMQEAGRSPDDPTAHYNFAFACGKEAKKHAADREMAGRYYALAISEYKRAIRLKPTSQLAYAGLANIYNETGYYDEAIKNFKKALAIKENSDLYNNLAVAYYCQGMYDEALRYCRRALYLSPGHVNGYINLGNAYLMKKEYGKARAAWLEAIKLGGSDPAVEARLRSFDGDLR